MKGLFKITHIAQTYLALTPVDQEGIKIRFHHAPASSVLRIQPPDAEKHYYVGDELYLDSTKLVPFMFLYLSGD